VAADEPPFLLDGALVLAFARVRRDASSRRHASAVAGGTPVDLDTVTRVVIAQSLADDLVYLLLCNDRWENFAAETHADAEHARRWCDTIFRDVALEWSDYRALSDEELAEVATTRAFLRELVSDPDINER
jgi:hypothetical protein